MQIRGLLAAAAVWLAVSPAAFAQTQITTAVIQGDLSRVHAQNVQRGPANKDVPDQECDGRNHEHEENQTAFRFFSVASGSHRSGRSFAPSKVGRVKDRRDVRLCGRRIDLCPCLADSVSHRLLSISEFSEQY